MLKRLRGWAVFGFVGVLAAAGWSHAQGAAQSAPTWADFARLQQSVMAMDQRLQAVEDALGQQPLPAAASTAGNEAMDQRLKAVEETLANVRASKASYSNDDAVKAVYRALYVDLGKQRDAYIKMMPDLLKKRDDNPARRNIPRRVNALKAVGHSMEERIEKNGW